MEGPFEKLDGVIEVMSGYTGSEFKNPTYKDVSLGMTGQIESNQITYDPSKISYEELLRVYFKQINPNDSGGQFADMGPQYSSAIFYHDTDQKLLAEKVISQIERSNIFDEPIVTKILKASKFYPAEEYHQDYYLKNPVRYAYYRHNCGRDKILKELWGEQH